MFRRYLCAVVGEDPARLRRLHRSSVERVISFGLAIHIPVLLWLGTTYLICRRIFDLDVYMSIGAASTSAFLIYLVERLVISTPGVWLMGFLRLAIALIVAFLGATGVDLILFQREIQTSLMETDTARAVARNDAVIQQQERVVEQLRGEWKAAEANAQCEADGTCGSRLRNIGPVYAAKKRDADRVRLDYESAAQALDLLRARKESELLSIRTSTQSLDAAGLLKRVQALHDYVRANNAALVGYSVLLTLMLLMELMVIIVKFAFRETVDDKIERIKEKVSEGRADAYLSALNSPTLSANQLLTTTYR